MQENGWTLMYNINWDQLSTISEIKCMLTRMWNLGYIYMSIHYIYKQVCMWVLYNMKEQETE